MITSAIFTFLIQEESVPKASRLDMAEKLKILDSAWLKEREPSLRSAAVDHLTSAVTGFFSGRFGDVCASLDRATSALTGREVSSDQALGIRISPLIVAHPTQPVTVTFFWLYPSSIPAKVDLSPGNTITLKPDEKVIRKALPLDQLGFIRNGSSVVAPIPGVTIRQFSLRIGGSARTFYSAIHPRGEADLLEWEKSADSGIQANARSLRRHSSSTGEQFQDPSLFYRSIRWIQDGRKLQDLASGGDLYDNRNGISFRFSFPKDLKRSTPLVIALHGAGGSEHMFFDSYGAGLVRKLSTDRRWAVISPLSSPNGAREAQSFFSSLVQEAPERVFLIGHSMGGGVVSNLMRPGGLSARGAALFAPATQALGNDTTPVFLAVGKNEIPGLLSTSRRISAGLNSQSLFREYENTEHLMVVAEALPDAFKFFDELLRTEKLSR
ncbi:MAG: alpha/beta fold hydrolase [Fimbriimonadaceae bacterium]|jgi:hypothetical protein|nr:alpha/beta fold hydrolase [Fimbriimonadaceae bacterium]